MKSTYFMNTNKRNKLLISIFMCIGFIALAIWNILKWNTLSTTKIVLLLCSILIFIVILLLELRFYFKGKKNI